MTTEGKSETLGRPWAATKRSFTVLLTWKMFAPCTNFCGAFWLRLCRAVPSNSGVWSVLMGPIGFSTGALAYSDFRKGLDILSKSSARAVELSALRNGELIPLLDSIDSLNLSQFSYVSFHALGQFETAQEPGIIEQLKRLLPRRWPVIVHPDAIRDFCAWVVFRDLLCVENMDKRKVGGRTAKELSEV